jgi:hypothetical protein
MPKFDINENCMGPEGYAEAAHRFEIADDGSVTHSYQILYVLGDDDRFGEDPNFCEVVNCFELDPSCQTKHHALELAKKSLSRLEQQIAEQRKLLELLEACNKYVSEALKPIQEELEQYLNSKDYWFAKSQHDSFVSYTLNCAQPKEEIDLKGGEDGSILKLYINSSGGLYFHEGCVYGKMEDFVEDIELYLREVGPDGIDKAHAHARRYRPENGEKLDAG